MKKDSKIYISGHTGLVGSALVRKLQVEGYTRLITRTHSELDLTQQADVENFFSKEKPEYLFLAAAKVGGILANNTYPAEFIHSNLAIQTNLLHTAWKVGCKRLIFLGSSCVYPRECLQPMKEEHLLAGPLEPTNQPYAVAKIAGIIQCEAYNRQYGTRFLAVMPSNLYGPNDNYDLEDSHVFQALIRKFHLAKLAAAGEWEAIKKDESRFGPIPEDILASLTSISKYHDHEIPEYALLLQRPARRTPQEGGSAPAVTLWGSGTPRREFLHVDDMADACLFLMNLSDEKYSQLLSSISNSALNLDRGGPEAQHSDNDVIPSASYTLPLINIGSGKDLSIRELADLVAKMVGFDGRVEWDMSKPDGTPHKLLDITRLTSLGWQPKIPFEEGIQRTYQDYLNAP